MMPFARHTIKRCVLDLLMELLCTGCYGTEDSKIIYRISYKNFAVDAILAGAGHHYCLLWTNSGVKIARICLQILYTTNFCIENIFVVLVAVCHHYHHNPVHLLQFYGKPGYPVHLLQFYGKPGYLLQFCGKLGYPVHLLQFYGKLGYLVHLLQFCGKPGYPVHLLQFYGKPGYPTSVLW